MEIFFLNTNFDGTNITEPLFNYLDFSMKQGLSYTSRKTTVMELSSNVGMLKDNYLGIDSDTDSYLSFF